MKSRGFSLIELAVVLVVLGVLSAIAIPRFLNLQSEARRAMRQETYLHLRSAWTLLYAKNRTPPTWNQLKDLLGTPTNLRLSSFCPSGSTVAYWDHNQNAACNAGERLAYLYADEACSVFLIQVSSYTVGVPIRCLRPHPDTVN